MTGPMNDGIACCGSPTARLIAGWPGRVSPSSSRSRTNGDRPMSGRAAEAGVTRSAAVMNIDKSGAGPPPRRLFYHRCGVVKTRLTIGGGRRNTPCDVPTLARTNLRRATSTRSDRMVRGPGRAGASRTARAVPGLRPNRISVTRLASPNDAQQLAPTDCAQITNQAPCHFPDAELTAWKQAVFSVGARAGGRAGADAA